jgi:hypothetical protein
MCSRMMMSGLKRSTICSAPSSGLPIVMAHLTPG